MKRIYSRLMEELLSGKFVFTAEIEAGKTTSLDKVIEAAKMLKNYVTAINITDNPGACAHMNPLVPAYVIQRDVGVEAVYQITCRDRNRIAIISDLLAAAALGIRNVLALTGDHVTMGDNPEAKPVFDLDSASLVYLIRRMVDEGVDLAGNKIEGEVKFHVGIAANPNAMPLELEILKIERKVRLGIDFIQTQCVFDMELTKEFLREVKKFNVPVLVGICPIRSIGMMKWYIKECPGGIKIPMEIQERLLTARERRGKKGVLEESIEISAELIKEIRKTTSAAGVHIMAIGFEWVIPQIIERTGLKC
ncbi:MAG: methylenetetrahydrofolate reductase [Thermoprotei archaeon]|nr:MAG: methylenetetrahydrofolate reductase [Thermoprotei archaeon]RLF25375.1 MAG: methylenetetrahydrofolate reductase [Thermoprotei archaeon]